MGAVTARPPTTQSESFESLGRGGTVRENCFIQEGMRGLPAPGGYCAYHFSPPALVSNNPITVIPRLPYLRPIQQICTHFYHLGHPHVPERPVLADTLSFSYNPEYCSYRGREHHCEISGVWWP